MPPDRSSASSQGSAGKGGASQPNKRPYAKANRSLKACDACHARKTRCSGDQPCNFCVSRGMRCVMSDEPARTSAPRAGPSRSQGKSSRQDTVEERQSQASTSTSPSVQVASSAPLPKGIPLAPYPSNTQLPPSLPIPLPPPGLFLPASRGVVSPQPSIYFNNTAPAANTIPPLRPPFASESAPLPFSQPREEPPPTRPPPSPAPQERPPFDATIFNRVQKPSRYMQEADITSLITNEKSNRYLDIYFSEAESIYQLWPVPSIIQHCHDLIWGDIPEAERYPETPLPQGLRSTLTALLAFGALINHDIRDSEVLYHAARSCFLHAIDCASLESVHLALQLAVFEMNTGRATAACSTLAIAIRIAQHLHLHRKSNLVGLPSEEVLRRSQLWYNCFIQDCWLSMVTGNPPLIREKDCDIEDSIYASRPDPNAPNFVSPFLHLLVRLSGIWNDAHTKLFPAQSSPDSKAQRSETLSVVDTELRLWQKDIHQLYARLSVKLNRSERLHCQAVLLTFSSMRLTVHRTFLQQTSSGPATKQTDTLQLILSQNAILDSAMDIVAYAKASLQLGMRLHFAFLATSLHIAYLALWEHMQTKQSPGRTDDTSRIEQSMNDILCVVERIHKSGDNAAMAEVVSAIKAMQQTPGRNLLTSVEPPLPTASPSEAGMHMVSPYDPARGQYGPSSYFTTDQNFSQPPRPSTSNQAYISRPAESRLYERSSWPSDLPRGNFR